MSPEEIAELLLMKFRERVQDTCYDTMTHRYDVDLTRGTLTEQLLIQMIAAELRTERNATDDQD